LSLIFACLIGVPVPAAAQQTTPPPFFFSQAVNYQPGAAGPSSVFLADVNHDGKLDMVVVNEYGGGPNGDSLVSVLLGNGDGTFQPPVTYDSGGPGAVSVYVADVNGDGWPDIVVANQGGGPNGDGSVGVLLNDGNVSGTFNQMGANPTTIYDSGGTNPNSNVTNAVLVMTINGEPAILVSNQADPKFHSTTGDGSVGVLLGKGDGTFNAVTTYDSGGVGATGLAAADLTDSTGTGLLDVVVANVCFNSSCSNQQGGISVLLNNGDGTFAPPISYLTDGPGVAVAVGDLNGDGFPDIFVGMSTYGTDELTNIADGTGTFNPAVMSGGTGQVTSVAIQDVNGDGINDQVIGVSYCDLCENPTYGVISVALGNKNSNSGKADGTFQAWVTYQSGGSLIYSMAFGDLNGDHTPDLAATNLCDVVIDNYCGGNVAVLLNSVNSLTTVVTASPNPAQIGQQVTYTATVTNPNGVAHTVATITFRDGTTVIGQPIQVTSDDEGSYRAVTNVNYPAAGTHQITATFSYTSKSPTLDSLIQISSILTENVLYPTATSLTSSSPSSIAGQPVTFTATITPTQGTIPIPDGDLVTFYDSGSEIGTGATAGGMATFTTTMLSVRSHTITATYNGDPTFASSTGTVAQTVSLINFSGSAAYFSMSSLGFNSSTAVPQTLMLTNVGGTPIAFTAPVAISSGFTITNAVCWNGAPILPPTLPIGEWCTFTIASDGSQSTGTMIFTDTAALSNLPSAQVGTNTQTIDLSFTAASGTTTLAPPSGTVMVTINESITVTDTVYVPPAVTLTGIVAPVAYYSAGSLGFVGAAAGQTVTQQLTVSNVGLQLMTISAEAIAQDTSNSFSVTQVQCSDGTTSIEDTIASGGACTLTISYTAPTNPPVTPAGAPCVSPCGTITFTDTAALSNVTSAGSSPNFTQTLALGTTVATTAAPAAPPTTIALNVAESITVNDAPAIPAIKISTTSLTFGSQNVGTPSATQVATVTNTGNVTLTIGVAVGGANPGDFVPTNACTSIAAGAYCTISVVFDPSATGGRTAQLSITDNVPGSPQMVSLAGIGVTPGITLSTATLAFGGVVTGLTSAAKTITLTNPGMGVLSISSITITGTNPGDFAETNTCGLTVLASGACTISVTFAPTAAGARSASVTVTDNVTGGPQMVALTGTGLLPLAVAPATLAFGSQGIGSPSAAKTVTLTNNTSASVSISSTAISGTNAADFADPTTTSTCGSTLASKTACTINITYTPSVSGAETATLTITDSAANSPQTVSLSGTGVGQITLSTASFAFGNQGIGSPSAAKTVTVTNNDSAAVAITSAASTEISGTNAADFAESASTCGATLASKAACTISITYTPSLSGAETATLTLVDSATNSPQTVSLTGTGVAQVALSPATGLSFGNEGINTTSAAKTVTVTNNTSASITISGIATTDSEFAPLSTCGSTLAGHTSCTVTATFSPSSSGPKSATLAVTDTATFSPQSVALTGTGVQPVSLSTSTLSFGNQGLDSTSAAKTLSLTNNNSVALDFANIVVGGTNSGDFDQSATTCGAPLAGHASCTISVTFTPSTLLAETAILTVTDNAGDSPQTVALSGSGVAQVTISPSTIAFGNQASGTTGGAKNVTFTNNTSNSVTIAPIAFGGTNAGDFAESGTTCQSNAPSGTLVGGHASCTISFTFTPSTSTAESATATITYGAANSPQTVTFSGTGLVPVSVTPASITYTTAQKVGTESAVKTVTVKNNLPTTLTINGITVVGTNSGDFLQSASTCGPSLGSGASCTVSVSFEPTATGARSAVLNVADSATTSPQTVALSGTGK
jgi:hypothetical protein